MTNGELIQKFFDCEVCEPIPEDDIIHVIFPDKNNSAIGFDWSWWNMEYKKPTTKDDLGVDAISREDVRSLLVKIVRKYMFGMSGKVFQDLYKGIDDLPSVTPQEPMVIPIAEVKFDEDKLKELVNRAVLTVTPQESCDYKVLYENYLKKSSIVIEQLRADRDRLLEDIDKIRAEIEKEADTSNRLHGISEIGLRKALKIIDKYKAESEKSGGKTDEADN